MALDLGLAAGPLTAQLVDIDSVSGGEQALADAIEAALAPLPHLSVYRDGNALIARTSLGRPQRVILAGHIDTVPIADNVPSRLDEDGVLAHVSPQYRTGTLTKAGIGEQLRAVFAIHDQVRARVRIDDVRLVGGLAWVYSTGDVTGRLRWVGGSVPVLSWQRELEVARREDGRWRLYGYQQ